jgi:hypothetical protein
MRWKSFTEADSEGIDGLSGRPWFAIKNVERLCAARAELRSQSSNLARASGPFASRTAFFGSELYLLIPFRSRRYFDGDGSLTSERDPLAAARRK